MPSPKAWLQNWFDRIVPPGERIFIFASLGALALISLFWAHPGTVIAQGDRYPILDSINDTARCATAWTNGNAYVGQLAACFSVAPYGLTYALFSSIFGPSYGQVLVTAVLVGSGWLGAFRCARAIGISPAMACIAAWAYALNPSRQGYLLILPTFDLTAALIPWFFYLMLSAANPERRTRATLWICAIASLLACVVAQTPQLLLGIAIGCLAWSFLAARFAPDPRAYAVWVIRTFAITALVSVWWAVPSAIAYLSGDITRNVTLIENSWIFGRASLLNELRFNASWSWGVPEYFPWAPVSDRVAPLYIATFVLAGGLISGLLLARGRELRVVRFCGALALVTLFLSKGTHEPFAFLNLWFFKLPGMFLFLEPLGAITVAAMCLAICLGIALDAAPRRLWGFALKPVLVASATGAIVLSNIPIATGAIFHEASGFEPAMHVRVPDYWRTLARYLNRSPSSGGVLVLPGDPSYQVDYTWGFYGSDALARDLLHREVLIPGALVGYVVPHAQISIERKLFGMLAARSALLAPVLRDLGIRYVLFRNDARMSSGFPFSARDVGAVFGAYPQQRFGALDLYDLGPAAGRLTSASAVISDVGRAREAGDQVELRSLEERLPRVHAPVPEQLSGLIAFIEAEPPTRVAGARLLWRANVGPAAGRVRGAAGGELRASYAVDRTPNSALVRSYAQLRFIHADDALPVPRVVGRSFGERGALDIDVIDPSARVVHCDVSVGVRPRRATSYTLFVNGIEVARAPVRPSEVATWARFSSVRILPGQNHLALRASSYPFVSYAPLLPPRAITGGAFDPYQGQVVFSMIRAALHPAPISSARAIRPLGLVTNVAVRNGARLLLESDVGIAGRASDWVIGITLRGVRYQCFERFNLGLPTDLGESVRSCFDATGRHLDADDEARLTITSLWLFHVSGAERGVFAPFDELRLSSRVEGPVIVDVAGATGAARFALPASGSATIVLHLPNRATSVRISANASDVSNAAIGAPPALSNETDLPVSAHFGGFYAAHIERDGPQVVIARDSYHPTWFAASIAPGFRILPHFEVDGWRNAWFTDRRGLFVALNELVLFQAVFGVLALVVLVWLWRAAR